MNETERMQAHIEAHEWVEVRDIVGKYCKEPTIDKDGTDILQDWLSHGSYDGNETPQQIAAQWDDTGDGS